MQDFFIFNFWGKQIDHEGILSFFSFLDIWGSAAQKGFFGVSWMHRQTAKFAISVLPRFTHFNAEFCENHLSYGIQNRCALFEPAQQTSMERHKLLLDLVRLVRT